MTIEIKVSFGVTSSYEDNWQGIVKYPSLMIDPHFHIQTQKKLISICQENEWKNTKKIIWHKQKRYVAWKFSLCEAAKIEMKRDIERRLYMLTSEK